MSALLWLDNKKDSNGRPVIRSISIRRSTIFSKTNSMHIARRRQHPLQKQYGLSARPAAHEHIDVWRENFKRRFAHHVPTGFTVSGAIDDLWIDESNRYIVVDYKATAKSNR